MKIAVIGATGLVGRMMLRVLEESSLFNNIALVPAASERSVGKKLSFRGKEVIVCSLRDALLENPNIVLFSAGTDISRAWAPEFVGDAGQYRATHIVRGFVPHAGQPKIASGTRV